MFMVLVLVNSLNGLVKLNCLEIYLNFNNVIAKLSAVIFLLAKHKDLTYNLALIGIIGQWILVVEHYTKDIAKYIIKL